MAFFDELKKGLAVTGQTVAQKTKELTESVQLKSQLKAEKEAMLKAYASIGKKVFENAAWDDKRKYESEFETINECLNKIEELKDKLSDLDGCIFCNECGFRIDKNSTYCSKCGAKVGVYKASETDIDDDNFVDEMKEEIADLIEDIKED